MEGGDFFEGGIELDLKVLALLFEAEEFLKGFESLVAGGAGVGEEGGALFSVWTLELDGGGRHNVRVEWLSG